MAHAIVGERFVMNEGDLKTHGEGPHGDKPGKLPDNFELIAIYNGQKKPLKVAKDELIKDVLTRVIALFGSLPNPHTLSLYTEDTGELKDDQTVEQAGLRPGEKILLRPSTVKAG